MLSITRLFSNKKAILEYACFLEVCYSNIFYYVYIKTSKQQGSHKVENTCIKDPFSTLWEHFCFNSIPCKPFFLVLMNFRQTRSHMQYQSVL